MLEDIEHRHRGVGPDRVAGLAAAVTTEPFGEQVVEQGRELFEAVVERGRMMYDVVAEQPGTRAEIEEHG